MKLIIISNRFPLKIVEENCSFKNIHSQGGVATGLDSLETEVEKHWVGWAGMYLEEGEEKNKIDKELENQNFHAVNLSPEQIENYYEGYSNSVIWPLCHYFPTYMHYEYKYWEAYKQVNSLFCAEALTIAEKDDIIWVQDYQLMLVPGYLREKMPEISIGYFHHIPFPSYELFRTLPERADILNGLLGADLIGFHTHTYMRHFISAVYRVLKIDCQLDEIQLERRIVNVDAFPMGINYEKFYDAILKPEVQQKVEEYRHNYGNGKLMISVDRLDYSKGIITRLKSFEDFLDNCPQYKGNVSLIMIVSPSRDNVDIYAELKNEIDKKVGALNGKLSTGEWTPVYYFYRSFDFDELAALYYLSDIALVTPLRDGMNLVCKEYVAAKRDKPGVLILSEMAGAAIELADAIIVNPTDTKEIEIAIAQAIEMPEEGQLKMMASLQRVVSCQTVKQWALDFVNELKTVKQENQELEDKIVEKKNFDIIKQQYNKARNRLLLIDYDGTLVRLQRNPEQAKPTEQVIDVLTQLSRDKRNNVIVTSGRNRPTLDKWLGNLPIGLAAEHGAFYKENGEWHGENKKVEWDEEILKILENTVKRTPHSWTEVKDTSIVWHYRDVDTWLADLRVNQLLNALISPSSRNNLVIMKGHKIIEIKPAGFSKGTEAKRLISNNNYDFIIAIGDDTTDEEMFMSLPENAISIKIGQNTKTAKYNIPTQELTIHFLKELSK